MSNQIRQYKFSVDSFQILNTRSRHKDTVFISASLAVGNRTPQTKTRHMGDLNNGIFDVGLTFDEFVTDDETVILSFVMINNGHTDPNAVVRGLEQATLQLAQQAAAAAATAGGAAIGAVLGASIGTAMIPVLGTALGALAGWIVSETGGLIFANCDGGVAAGVHPFTGAQLREATDGGIFRQTDDNPGTDSAHGCGSNSHYLVNWSIDETTPLLRQTNWRWCRKCQGLHFAGNPGSRCPAGGEHIHDGSGNYALSHNDPQAPGQDNWRWCRKCHSLHFAGNPGSQCPAGGEHIHDGSGNYTLVHNDSQAPGQENWRWCHKCQGLHFAGNPGSRCPAGGEHVHDGSGNYTLLEV